MSAALSFLSGVIFLAFSVLLALSGSEAQRSSLGAVLKSMFDPGTPTTAMLSVAGSTLTALGIIRAVRRLHRIDR